MPALRILSLFLIVLVIAGCRPTTPSDEPMRHIQRTYEEVARGSADVAGTYTLTGLDARSLPALAASEGGCRIELTEGQLQLNEDGTYSLRLASRSICNDEVVDHGPGDEIMVEGLYSLVGNRLRFGDKMLIQRADPAPQTVTGPEELVYALLHGPGLAALGHVRADRVSFTIRDLRTYVFRKA